ncbi:hypothetical protein BC939DRAFT_467689 [Gamsiella multidivaricata]|uniref:uncharacterized protein n=1 Tax=Gamsiella multidivaricata TaxID=101098 RepID=UPI00222025F3|nr:uncharacterized protein BC939DRAFT_467689 [Gamsiella multidivaricata]KAI7816830.1 hypothetical protein BC939DRAFT_467689 [Gamsiella multidivaricata]
MTLCTIPFIFASIASLLLCSSSEVSALSKEICQISRCLLTSGCNSDPGRPTCGLDHIHAAQRDPLRTTGLAHGSCSCWS